MLYFISVMLSLQKHTYMQCYFPSGPFNCAMHGQLERGFVTTQCPFQSTLRKAKALEIPQTSGTIWPL